MQPPRAWGRMAARIAAACNNVVMRACWGWGCLGCLGRVGSSNVEAQGVVCAALCGHQHCAKAALLTQPLLMPVPLKLGGTAVMAAVLGGWFAWWLKQEHGAWASACPFGKI